MAGVKGRSGRRPRPAVERFWAKVRKTEGDGCWEWQGGRLLSGYGIFSNKPGMRGAHRFSWVLHYGSIPPGLYVCHRCDNPPCVRPDHLFLGTARDNALDKVAKGRAGVVRGEEQHCAALTEVDVRAIRARYAAREAGYKRLAREYGVTPMTIANVVYGRTWKHVA